MKRNCLREDEIRLYLKPEIEVIEMESEGVICASGAEGDGEDVSWTDSDF